LGGCRQLLVRFHYRLSYGTPNLQENNPGTFISSLTFKVISKRVHDCCKTVEILALMWKRSGRQWESDNDNGKQCKRCNNIVSYEFLWKRDYS